MSPSLKSQRFHALIVDDDPTVQKVLETRLVRKGHTVTLAGSGSEALTLVHRTHFDVVLTDLKMPGPIDGFGVVSAVAKLNRPLGCLIMTGHGDKESAIRAVELGAFAFFEKPFDLDAIELALTRSVERTHLETERRGLLQKLESLCKLQNRELEHVQAQFPSHIIGSCEPINHIKSVLGRLALKPKAGVMIAGETGTGKEVIARELHHLTHKQGHMPFVALNCSAIPFDLFESELFGHEKGSFTGATTSRVGLCEAAREGTLFLDEVADLDPRHQTKLLRLLQERTFRKVGGSVELGFEGRIVAASHKNLKVEVNEGRFREDLYYRLSLVTLEAPPLRSRGPDILEIAQFFCKKFGLKGLAPERLAEIHTHAWPGNIRELSNWIERGSILDQVDPEGLLTAPLPSESLSIPTQKRESISSPHHPTEPLLDRTQNAPLKLKDMRQEMLRQVDSTAIKQALEQSRGNVSKTASALGIDRKNLSRRMRELGISADIHAPAGPHKKRAA